MEAFDHGSVVFRNAVAERLGAIRGGNAGGVEKIFPAPGNAVQRAAVFSGGDFFVGLFGLGEREIARKRNDAAQLGIELLDAAEVDLREALGSKFALLDPAGELRDGSEGDVGVVRRQRTGVGLGADELIALRASRLTRENGMVARERCERGFERDSAWTSAPLIQRSQVYAPRVRGESAVGGR